MPKSTRAWQHVLEPLFGYILLGFRQYNEPVKFSSSWNFGPENTNKSVIDLISSLNSHNEKKVKILIKNSGKFKEANLLQLNCEKANLYLDWKPKLDFNQTVLLTSDWYKKSLLDSNSSLYNFSIKQIYQYLEI